MSYHLAHLHYLYYAGTEAVLDPTALRSVLSERGMVSIGEKADSAEILNYLLMQIHETTVFGECYDPSNEPCGDICPAHNSFRLELMEQDMCLCGTNSEPKPWDFCSFMFPLHVDEIHAQARTRYDVWWDYIGKLKECYSGKQSFEQCVSHPPRCKRSERMYTVLNAPEVLFLGLTGKWDSLTLQCRKVMEITSIFPGILHIKAIFPSTHLETQYRLRSWIAFGLGHYVAYIRHSHNDTWRKYNDRKVELKGDYFTCIKDEVDCNFHPVAFFYEKIVGDSQSFSRYNELEKWENVLKRIQEIEQRNGIFDYQVQDSTWCCSKCTLQNDSLMTVCSVCDTPRVRPVASQQVNDVSGAQVVKTYVLSAPKPQLALPAQTLPRPMVLRCTMCLGQHPNGKVCECRLYASVSEESKLICPNCRLLNDATSVTCDNCNTKLTVMHLSQPCVRCGVEVTGRGYCLKCLLEVRSSPCVYCQDSQLVCSQCSKADS